MQTYPSFEEFTKKELKQCVDEVENEIIHELSRASNPELTKDQIKALKRSLKNLNKQARNKFKGNYKNDSFLEQVMSSVRVSFFMYECLKEEGFFTCSKPA